MLTSTEDLDHQRSSFEDKSLRDQSIWYRADSVDEGGRWGFFDKLFKIMKGKKEQVCSMRVTEEESGDRGHKRSKKTSVQQKKELLNIWAVDKLPLRGMQAGT